jgi:hypothetical protein
VSLLLLLLLLVRVRMIIAAEKAAARLDKQRAVVRNGNGVGHSVVNSIDDMRVGKLAQFKFKFVAESGETRAVAELRIGELGCRTSSSSWWCERTLLKSILIC